MLSPYESAHSPDLPVGRLFACQGLDDTRSQDSKRVLTRCSRSTGAGVDSVPDNGVPFS